MAAIVQQQVNITPSELNHEQDQLLVAGAKISYLDIYNEQMRIPLVKNKFYKARDVDSLFVTMNGVLIDVSKHAHRQNFLLSESRKDLTHAQDEIAKLKAELEALKESTPAIVSYENTDETDQLRQALEQKHREFDSLVRQFGVKYKTLQAELEITKTELETKKLELENTKNELKESEDARFSLIAQIANT